jgi:DNA processing protein
MSPTAQKNNDFSALTAGERVSELAAIVALMRSGVVSPIHGISTVVDQFGSAVEVVRMNAAAWSSADATQQQLLKPLGPDDVAKALADAQQWLEEGIDIRSVLDASYPDNLHTIFNRPPLVFVSGAWRDEVDARAVAIVGTRKPSAEGVKRARKLAHELVRAGYTILSGLAAGIDTAAHTAALEIGGRTAAVMGTGLRRIYPAENRPLANEILAAGGALISQFFPDQPPTKWTFPFRNVVMSGLSVASVVIEASETSGARMQARIALEHGRTVFLPSSLVKSHEWARRYTTDGVYGTRAIEVATADEVVRRLEGAPLDAAAAG